MPPKKGLASLNDYKGSAGPDEDDDDGAEGDKARRSYVGSE